jgi:hypothetical protein
MDVAGLNWELDATLDAHLAGSDTRGGKGVGMLGFGGGLELPPPKEDEIFESEVLVTSMLVTHAPVSALSTYMQFVLSDLD